MRRRHRLVRSPPPARLEHTADARPSQQSPSSGQTPSTDPGPVVRNAHVAELRIHQAVHERAVHRCPASDARPHGGVAERPEPREPPQCSPAPQRSRRCRRRRGRRAAAELVPDVGVGPAGLGVVVMRPTSMTRSGSTGPIEPIPAPPTASPLSKNADDTVDRLGRRRGRGRLAGARGSSAPVPIAHSPFEPPLSMPP